MSSVYTIGQFLDGVSVLVTDKAISYVCAKRGIDADAPYTSISQRDAELAEGTLYYWLSNLPVGGATEKIADGEWSHSEGGWTVSKANIDEWNKKYRSLFQKWNEPLMTTSSVRLMNF